MLQMGKLRPTAWEGGTLRASVGLSAWWPTARPWTRASWFSPGYSPQGHSDEGTELGPGTPFRA